MAIYTFSYDLVNENGGYDYEPLWSELKRLGGHRVQQSSWLLNLNKTPKEVIDHFKALTDSDDRLWVSSVRSKEYWYTNAMSGTNDWLKQNKPTAVH